MKLKIRLKKFFLEGGIKFEGLIQRKYTIEEFEDLKLGITLDPFYLHGFKFRL